MPAPVALSRIVADWIVETIEARIAAGEFSAACVTRLNSVNIAREKLTVDKLGIFVAPADVDPLALRDGDFAEETTLTEVVIAKRVANPDENDESDPVIDQVSAIYRWFITHSDHQTACGVRRLDKEQSELITLIDQALLHEQSIAVGGFVLAFVEDRTPADDYED